MVHHNKKSKLRNSEPLTGEGSLQGSTRAIHDGHIARIEAILGRKAGAQDVMESYRQAVLHGNDDAVEAAQENVRDVLRASLPEEVDRLIYWQHLQKTALEQAVRPTQNRSDQRIKVIPIVEDVFVRLDQDTKSDSATNKYLHSAITARRDQLIEGEREPLLAVAVEMDPLLREAIVYYRSHATAATTARLEQMKWAIIDRFELWGASRGESSAIWQKLQHSAEIAGGNFAARVALRHATPQPPLPSRH